MATKGTSRFVGVVALLLAGILGTFGFTVAAQPRASQTCIKGVWRAAEIRYTGPNARTVSDPQPWFVIFTDKHLASIGVTSDAARRELPPADKQTDKDLADAFRGLQAYAATYDVSGGEFTRTHIVAASPNAMRSVATTSFKCDGNDVLWWTQSRGAAGPIANPTTWKFVRVE